MQSTKRIFYDKLFPKKEGVKLQDLLIDEESISYITTPYDSEKIGLLIAQYMEKKFNLNEKNITIVDASACVGGDTITFCYMFGIVIPIEINKLRFSYLLNNLKVYNIKNAYPVLGDSNKIIPDIQPTIDIIFLDPPWGGRGYKDFDKLELTFGNSDLDVAIKNFFIKKPELKLIVLKLPKNYNMEKLKEKLGNSFQITIYDFLKKMNIVMINKQINK